MNEVMIVQLEGKGRDWDLYKTKNKECQFHIPHYITRPKADNRIPPLAYIKITFEKI